MSKGPTPRHSKSPKPLTIDLDAKDVTPQSASSAETKPATDKTKPAGKPAEAALSKSSGSTPRVSAAGATTPATKPKPRRTRSPPDLAPSLSNFRCGHQLHCQIRAFRLGCARERIQFNAGPSPGTEGASSKGPSTG